MTVDNREDQYHITSTFLSRYYYITYNRLMTIQENVCKVNHITTTSFTQTTKAKQKEKSSGQKTHGLAIYHK